ncbi:biopolymer transporter ExbD [Horticoccus luteus]|uniref:Biopolymer transporter ExbD n=1 Tax=Horticoccus luteus TaxID=2862869 RepID=A0A8F9XK59_9BACT|nr:biopolymer transporter ExbD [Horticoccus luteus]QYM77754.1 biopolymer transporter ExbD [Horticoccus luteus]
MARTFRRKQAAHPISELNVTNLIDVAFTLLIIFMIATPLIQQEQTIPINLPAESKSAQQPPDKDQRFVAISINGQGEYYVSDQPVSFRELQSKLRAFAEEAKPPVIRIRGDAKVPYEKVIQLMDELKKNNLSKVTFDTQAEG